MPTQLTGGQAEGLADEVADLKVLADEGRHVLGGEPLGLPVVDVAEADRVRMYFIAHGGLLPFGALIGDDDGQVADFSLEGVRRGPGERA